MPEADLMTRVESMTFVKQMNRQTDLFTDAIVRHNGSSTWPARNVETSLQHRGENKANSALNTTKYARQPIGCAKISFSARSYPDVPPIYQAPGTGVPA